jgi:uncharacterized integral membrane protein (TIGR00697 family)
MNASNVASFLSVYKKRYILNSKYIPLFMMLYTTIGLATLAVSFRFVQMVGLTISGATLIFGLNFYILDITTEVYGYSVSRKIIWLGFLSELLFALSTWLVVSLPFPSFFNSYDNYQIVFGNLTKFTLSAFAADFAGMFISSFLMSKWKIMTHGRYFWLRSFITTATADFIMTFIVGIGAFSSKVTDVALIKILASGYLVHLIYAAILIWPAFYIALLLKKIEKIDVYDTDINYNPFKF